MDRLEQHKDECCGEEEVNQDGNDATNLQRKHVVKNFFHCVYLNAFRRTLRTAGGCIPCMQQPLYHNR